MVCYHFQRIQNCTDGTTGISVNILFIGKLLKKSERRFENFEHMKFAVSFFTKSQQERDVIADLVYVFKENVSEVELEIITSKLQTDF